MPSHIVIEDIKGIPPLEGEIFRWDGEDGPLLCQMALELYQSGIDRYSPDEAAAIQSCIKTAANIAMQVAIYMNAENTATFDRIQAHAKKHSRIVRLRDLDDKII